MKVCNNCVLDNSTVNDLYFDGDGVCNYCNNFYSSISKNWFPNEKGEELLKNQINKIKKLGKNKEYDCIIGLSGGIDSSYMTFKSKEWGLRPLVVHVDAGWNTELAVSNIEKVINYTGFDLHTEVINWDDMKRLQIAYLKSGISNQDVPQDHIFFSTLYHYSIKHKINYSISGGNIATESILPDNWHGSAMDSINLKSIFKTHGTGKLLNYKTISFFQYFLLYPILYNLKTIRPLNYMRYNKDEALHELEKIGYKKYDGKHGESIFTKFFQEIYLPRKYNIDKRKAHLSSLILSDQITRENALKILSQPLITKEDENMTIDYVCKKLDITKSELNQFIKNKNRDYSHYSNWDNLRYFLSWSHKLYRRLTGKSIHITR